MWAFLLVFIPRKVGFKIKMCFTSLSECPWMQPRPWHLADMHMTQQPARCFDYTENVFPPNKTFFQSDSSPSSRILFKIFCQIIWVSFFLWIRVNKLQKRHPTCLHCVFLLTCNKRLQTVKKKRSIKLEKKCHLYWVIALVTTRVQLFKTFYKF